MVAVAVVVCADVRARCRRHKINYSVAGVFVRAERKKGAETTGRKIPLEHARTRTKPGGTLSRRSTLSTPNSAVPVYEANSREGARRTTATHYLYHYLLK